MMQKTITLTANKAELTFEVTTDKYNKYINELSLSNKIAPAHNFLMRCVLKTAGPPSRNFWNSRVLRFRSRRSLLRSSSLTDAGAGKVERRAAELKSRLGAAYGLCHRWFPGRQRTRTAWLRRFSLNSTTGKRWGLPWRTALQGHSGEPDGEAGKAHVQHWRP